MKRIVGALLLVLAILGTINVVRQFSETTPTPSSGSAAYDSGRKVGRYSAPAVLVALGILGLRWLFQSDESRPAPPPRRSPTGGSSLPPPGDPSLRGAQNTFASNPARLRLETAHYLAANPWLPIVTGAMALLGFVLLFIKLPVGIVLLVSAAIVLLRQLREAQQKFFMGDVCPAIVLSAQQNLVAVFTDLKAAAPFPRPAIKILKQPLGRITVEPAYDGMRLAAAALYHGQVQQAAWQNFSPEIIHCVCRNPEEVARVMASIPADDWQALDTYLAQVPVAQPGLYRMWNAATPAGVPAQGAPDFAPPRPWYTSTAAIIGLSILGALVGLVLLFNIAIWALRPGAHRNATNQPAYPLNPTPSPGAQPIPSPSHRPPAPTQTGPYTVGAAINAQWAGKWIPATIVSINPGGFSLMVQLQDARFPHPIVLSTNQIRLR